MTLWSALLKESEQLEERGEIVALAVMSLEGAISDGRSEDRAQAHFYMAHLLKDFEEQAVDTDKQEQVAHALGADCSDPFKLRGRREFALRAACAWVPDEDYVPYAEHSNLHLEVGSRILA